MWSFVIVSLLLTILSSCSGGGSSPIMPGSPEGEPDLTGATGQMERDASSHILWGFWQIVLDTQTMEIEVVPLRGASFHMNVSRILDGSAIGLRYRINLLNITARLLDFDVTITHPVPDSNLRGFDIRGILMGPGNTVVSETDPALVYNALNGTRLLNADGYTRWWNAVEFTDAGLFGYDNNQVIPGFLIPTTTLNPYKYFSDPLGPTEPVVPGVNESNRGTFSTDGTPPSLTRNYQVQYSVIGGKPKLGFHYAIDASWTIPTGNSPSPKPIEDFPPQANCPEAFHIQVNTDNSTVWYEGEDKNGGDLVLDIEVYDWQAADNPEGIAGEIAGIVIESQTLCDPYYVQPMMGTQGTGATSGVYHVTIPNVHPTDVMNQEILVTVKSKTPNSYMPPFNGSDYPESAALAAYAIVEVPVSPFEVQSTSLRLLSPNGEEVIVAGDPAGYDIVWSGGEEDTRVAILLSSNSGEEYLEQITLSTPNDGTHNWYIDPEIAAGCYYRVKIFVSGNPALFDESDDDFTIFPESESSIAVLSPNGGEEWGRGSTKHITWTSLPNIAEVMIELSLDEGRTYLPEHVIVECTSNDSDFIWEDIPEWATGEGNVIRISDAQNLVDNDESDCPFSVIDPQEPFIKVDLPNGLETVLIGSESAISWNWCGDIPEVDIEVSINGGFAYDHVIAENLPNTGVLNIAPEDWNSGPGIPGVLSWIREPYLWTSDNTVLYKGSPTLEARVRVTESGGALSDESDDNFYIPLNLGILHEKSLQSAEGDSDGDAIADDVEVYIGTNPSHADSDKDWLSDYEEIFSIGFFNGPGFNPDSPLPNFDGDDELSATDTDDNNDEIHDGELIDSDGDNIPNYLEYYGYTWDWLTGQFSLWDGIDVEIDYFKTDPMQVSTDQDPYHDDMETSKLNMDVSVEAPGDSPMVPAYPNISISLEGYEVTLNQEITTSEGGSESEGTTWEAGTEHSDTSTMEHGWEFGQSYKAGVSAGLPTFEAETHWSVHGNYGSGSTDTTSYSDGGSHEISGNWSTATCSNPSNAAKIKLYIKICNRGTAAASNIIPTFTLMIGNYAIATFEPGNAQVNLLAPGDIYPPAEGVYWVIDSIDTGTGVEDITLTLDELRALESSAPVRMVLNQVQAEVMLLKDGEWQSAGNWAEYKARCEAVCADIILDNGQGEVIHSLVYADDSVSAPEVTLRDALIWVADAHDATEGPNAGKPVIPFKQEDGTIDEIPLENWHISFEPDTYLDLVAQAAAWDEQHQGEPDPPPFNLFDLLLRPDTEITFRAGRPSDLYPFLHFASLDENSQTVIVCVTDFSDINAVSFVDKWGTAHPMSEIYWGSAFWFLNLQDIWPDGYEASGFGVEEQTEHLIVSYKADVDYDDYVCMPDALGIIYDISTISPVIISTDYNGNYATIEAEVSPNGGSSITDVWLEIVGRPTIPLDNIAGNVWRGQVECWDLYGPVGNEIIRVRNSAGLQSLEHHVCGSNPHHVSSYNLNTGNPLESRQFDLLTGTRYNLGWRTPSHFLLNEHRVALGHDAVELTYITEQPGDDLEVYKMPAGSSGGFESYRLDYLEYCRPLMQSEPSTLEARQDDVFLIWTGTHYVKMLCTDINFNSETNCGFYFDFVTFSNPEECVFDEVFFNGNRARIEALVSAQTCETFDTATPVVHVSRWDEPGPPYEVSYPMTRASDRLWVWDVFERNDWPSSYAPEMDYSYVVELQSDSDNTYKCRLTDADQPPVLVVGNPLQLGPPPLLGYACFEFINQDATCNDPFDLRIFDGSLFYYLEFDNEFNGEWEHYPNGSPIANTWKELSLTDLESLYLQNEDTYYFLNSLNAGDVFVYHNDTQYGGRDLYTLMYIKAIWESSLEFRYITFEKHH